MQRVKGMVQVAGATYRIVRVQHGHYTVYRILDDQVVGTFRCVPGLEVTSSSGDEVLMMKIARAAIQKGQTSWVGRINLG